MTTQPTDQYLPVDDWRTPQNILVILAHPDDPEFFCGATIAQWISQGHVVKYCLFTRGEKGGQELLVSPAELADIREKEQISAANVLGVQNVHFLGYSDGCLEATLEARRDIVRIIRNQRPTIVVTCDPTNLFPRPNSINHPDHRNAGQIVVDAVFPAIGNPHYFPELIQEENLQPHSIKELWLSVTAQPNIRIDVTDWWDTKIRALHSHKSQTGNIEQFDQYMRNKHTEDSSIEHPRYEEVFLRIVFP